MKPEALDRNPRAANLMSLATPQDWMRRTRRWWNRCRENAPGGLLSPASCQANSYIDESAQVLGWQQVRIGHHTIIGESTWINVNQRDSGKCFTR